MEIKEGEAEAAGKELRKGGIENHKGKERGEKTENMEYAFTGKRGARSGAEGEGGRGRSSKRWR